MQGRLLHFYGRNLVLENMHSDLCARYILFNQRENVRSARDLRSDRIQLTKPRVIRLHIISIVHVDRFEDTRTTMKFSRGKSLESTASIRPKNSRIWQGCADASGLRSNPYAAARSR